MSVTEIRLRFNARNGQELGGLLISSATPKAGLLISSATAVTTEFYTHFARHAASRGFACLLYDCRGVGSSRPEQLKGFSANMVDWGKLDAPAALDELQRQAPDLPLFTIGHSVGGHFIGFMDNHNKITANALVAVGSGYWGVHRATEWLLEFLFFYLIGPLNIWRNGYLKHQGKWQGTDLPAGVYWQWRKWCLTKEYLAKDLASGKLGEHWFDKVSSPIRSYGFSDDPVVTPKSLAKTLGWYSNSPQETVWVEANANGLGKIGHMGMFSRRNAKFWDQPLNWFESFLG
ncbi:MAG: alpha/beta fold hydrolase [Robiginitomaculum sp.]|nr:alpha/beta fold hydrolase [Robiginitomaculum sp.]